MLVGRLKPGVTAAAADAELKTLAVNLERAWPVEQKDQTFMTEQLSRFSLSTSPTSGNNIKRLAPLLFGMSGVVLLVACLNLANMLLARGAARRKDIAIWLCAWGQSLADCAAVTLAKVLSSRWPAAASVLMLGLWSSDLLVASLEKSFDADLISSGKAA